MSDAVERFLRSLETRDYEGLAHALTPTARLRALVPTALREAEGPDAIVERFRIWTGDLGDYQFSAGEPEDVLGQVRLRYRFRGVDAEDGLVESEQHVYATVEDGRISALNLVCSGFKPL